MGYFCLCAVLLVVGQWFSSAHAQAERPVVPVPEALGPLGGRSCLETRDSLERMLYVTFKGSLPRRMLKEVLPGLVDSLLPVMCMQPGSEAGKWLQQHLAKLPSPSSRRLLSRHKRQMGFFMPFMPGMTGAAGGAKIKDPGDHPPPGMTHNPFKDPGDRPFNFFGVPIRKIKDPQDRLPPSGGGATGEAPPPGEFAGLRQMMSMMTMMRVMNAFQRQMASMSAPGGAAAAAGGPGSGGTGGGSGGAI